jgi:hypothetical protein
MDDVINNLNALFDEAQQRSESDFVLTIMNFKGMGAKELVTNLYEWFDAIEFYKKLYLSLTGKEKARIGLLLYSTFFESGDLYNIIGSLCRIKMGFKGSSYLFWKTRKYERLLGIGEKHDFLIELLNDTGKAHIIDFFNENHVKEIRNTFFHSAYSLDDEDYHLHDSENVDIKGVGYSHFNIETFLYPKIGNVIRLFDAFKKKYFDSLDSYKEDKKVIGFFPTPIEVTILGSDEGLKGFRMKNSVQFFGEWHDSGIWHDEKWNMWTAFNMRTYFDNIETLEIQDQLSRYESKDNINRSNVEFQNLLDKIAERNMSPEIVRVTLLLKKFGDLRYQQMADEANPHKKKSLYPGILHYYKQAVDLGSKFIDVKEIQKRIGELEAI